MAKKIEIVDSINESDVKNGTIVQIGSCLYLKVKGGDVSRYLRLEQNPNNWDYRPNGDITKVFSATTGQLIMRVK